VNIDSSSGRARSYFDPGALPAAERERLSRQAEILVELEWPVLAPILARATGPLLDLGCGHGAWLALLASRQPGLTVVGVDHNADLLEAASERLPEVAWERADLVDVRAVESLMARWRPSVVVARYTLQHLSKGHRVALLSALHDSMSGTGKVVLIEPDDSQVVISPACEAFSLAVSGNIERQARLGGNRALGGQLGGLARQAGFENVEASCVWIERATVSWRGVKEVFWPVARRGLQELPERDAERAASDVEEWLRRGDEDVRHDYRKPLYIVACGMESA
jgi:SAM-dependent methyltransferase